jgi:glycosyltransferase involved in cell wall biosynthesis
MNKQKSVSFIISAHNEEKILGRALKALEDLPYSNYEVVLGLDGCTDRTLEIVKDFQKRKPGIFRYVELNARKGKAHVLNQIIPLAKGEIIIIHDADWYFKVNREGDFKEMMKWFEEDSKLGGVLESFPVEWAPKRVEKNNSMAFLSIAWTSFFWIEYLKDKFSFRKNNVLYADPKNENFPFELNIMRKKLYRPNETLGDAWERAQDVIEQGYSLRLVEDEEFPRMQASYSKARFVDIIKQKKRTAISREQIKEKYPYLNFNPVNFHFPLLFYMFRNMHKVKRFRALIGIFIWLGIMGNAMVFHQVKRLNPITREGWIKKKYEPGTHENWVLRAKR